MSGAPKLRLAASDGAVVEAEKAIEARETAAEPARDVLPALTPLAPSLFAKPLTQALCYMGAAFILSLATGIGLNAFSANINQLQGSFGVTQTEATWLSAAYMAPNVSLTLILVKARTQFGLRRFAEIGILIFVAVSAIHLYVDDFRTALTLRFFAGAAASPMSSMAFLYTLEAFVPARKMNVGLCLALANAGVATPIARLISPPLLDLGQWHAIYMVELGFALIALVCVYLLPLTSPPRAKVISFLDLVSYGFLAVGFGCVAVVLSVGRLYWWFEADWIGILLIVAVICLATAAVIELNRSSPLIDVRWLTSGPVLHFAAALLLVRILLTEQSGGAVAFMSQLGLLPAQTAPMWCAILLATIIGGISCAFLMKPSQHPGVHALALMLVGIGAYMDAQSTNLTRPLQMVVSQMMVAAGTALFLPPALSAGLAMAMKNGPTYILSFVVIFLMTQSLGGLLGSALYGTFVTIREKFHSAHLVEQMVMTDPNVALRISQLSGAYGKVIQDKTLLNAEGLQLLAQQTTKEAYVLAYNDVFLATATVCALALAALIIHLSINSLRSAFAVAKPQN